MAKSQSQKDAQKRRTRENKIKRLTKMLEQNPNNEHALTRLEFWTNQKS